MSKINTSNIIKHLKGDLAGDNTQNQLQCISHLLNITKILEHDEVIQLLLPTLHNYCWDESFKLSKEGLTTFRKGSNEEVIAGIAKQLNGDFLVAAGGYENCKLQLEMLEKLAGAEETVIREKTVDSLKSCLDPLTEQQATELVLPIFNRLHTTAFWSSRSVAACLSASLYKKLQDKEIRMGLLSAHKKTIRDDMPLVRENAFKEIINFAKIASSSFYTSHCRLWLHHLCNENIQSPCLSSLVDISISFLESFESKAKQGNPAPKEEIEICTVEWLQKACQSASWRLRCHFTKNLTKILTHYTNLNLAQEVINEKLLPVILNLIDDTEPQVRVLALEHVRNALKFFDLQPYQQTIMKKLQEVLLDQNKDVREKLAETIIDYFVDCKLDSSELPSILQRLNDASEVGNAIIWNICKSMAKLYSYLSAEEIATITSLVEQWSKDTRWRTRHALVSNIGGIVKVMNQSQFNSSIFKTLLITSFKDPVFDIRETVCSQMCNLFNVYETEYIEKEVLEGIPSLVESKNYVHRMVVYQTIKALASAEPLNVTFWQFNFLPLLAKGLTDEVANVRIAVCDAITATAQRTKNYLQPELSNIKKALRTAQEDSDADVQYFASVAYTALAKF